MDLGTVSSTQTRLKMKILINVITKYTIHVLILAFICVWISKIQHSAIADIPTGNLVGDWCGVASNGGIYRLRIKNDGGAVMVFKDIRTELLAWQIPPLKYNETPQIISAKSLTKNTLDIQFSISAKSTWMSQYITMERIREDDSVRVVVIFRRENEMQKQQDIANKWIAKQGSQRIE